MSYTGEWLQAMVAAGPRGRVVNCNSSIDPGTKIVQYCINGVYCYGEVTAVFEHVIFPHPVASSYVLFKIQPWTVERGTLGAYFPRARISLLPCELVFSNCVTGLTVSLWPVIPADASGGFTHNLIFIQ